MSSLTDIERILRDGPLSTEVRQHLPITDLPPFWELPSLQDTSLADLTGMPEWVWERLTQPQYPVPLPLRQVAEQWGLPIHAYNHRKGMPNGSYDRSTITLHVHNVSTFFHELVHAADDRLTGLNGPAGDTEIVAALGTILLLRHFHMPDELKHHWGYIKSWSAGDPVADVRRLARRAVDAVELILRS